MDQHNTGDELTCRELVELVTDYLEQALPAPERARFDAHLAACEGCRDYLDQIRRTIGVLGRLDPATLTDDERTRLIALFRGWRAGAGR
ncbi:MAG: hypothetical protein OHK0015_27470 [Chloroflexi bacterium OHK40]